MMLCERLVPIEVPHRGDRATGDLTVVGVFRRTAGGRHAGDHKRNRPARHHTANHGGVVVRRTLNGPRFGGVLHGPKPPLELTGAPICLAVEEQPRLPRVSDPHRRACTGIAITPPPRRCRSAERVKSRRPDRTRRRPLSGRSARLAGGRDASKALLGAASVLIGKTNALSLRRPTRHND